MRRFTFKLTTPLKQVYDIIREKDNKTSHQEETIFFYRCTVHSDIDTVHSRTKAPFIKIEKVQNVH
jgi:hypothetical protein